jgi:hypothetical protein
MKALRLLKKNRVCLVMNTDAKVRKIKRDAARIPRIVAWRCRSKPSMPKVSRNLTIRELGGLACIPLILKAAMIPIIPTATKSTRANTICSNITSGIFL